MASLGAAFVVAAVLVLPSNYGAARSNESVDAGRADGAASCQELMAPQCSLEVLGKTDWYHLSLVNLYSINK